MARSSSWFFSRMPLSSLTPSGSTSATATKTPLGITWLRAEMPNTMWSQRQTPSSSIAASETFGHQPGPTYGNRFRQDCLASQQPSTKPRPRRTASARCAAAAGAGGRHLRAGPRGASEAGLCGQRADFAGAVRRLPQREDAERARSPESRVAPGIMEYPKLPPLVFEAQTCAKDSTYVGVDVVRCKRNGLANAPFPLPILCPADGVEPVDGVLPDLGLLPLRRAGHFPLRLQQLQKNLVRQAGQVLAPVLLPQRLAPPPQHLALLRQLSDPGAPPQPQPAVLRRAADGHLGALAGGHELALRLPQVLAPEQPRLHVRGVKAPPLLDGRQGLPRLAPAEHARRGPVHVAVPVEGQEAHGAVLLQGRIVAVHQVALRAQHAHRGVAPHAELSHLLGGDPEAPPVVAQHGVKVGAHLLHAQLQQLGQLPGHAERLVLEGARQHVLLAGQLEAHAPQAPHALAQERLHLRAGVPVARALRVKEAESCRMGPPGSSEASTCCLTRCATCSSVRCAGCLVAPPSSFTGSQSLRS